MPFTTVVTTTAITTSIWQSSPSQSTVQSTMSTMTSATTTENDKVSCEQKMDSKRKKPVESDQLEDNLEQKRRNVNPSAIEMAVPSSLDGTTLMQRILAEVVGVRSVVSNLEAETKKLTESVNEMQCENKEWRQKMKSLEKEVSEVKESVNFAHDMINDETKNQKDSEKTIKSELQDRAREISNNVQFIKSHSSELRSLKDDMNNAKQKMDVLQ